MYVLVWAAKTYSVPVQMAVADFCGQKGLIVSIDDSGTLSIHFLGNKSVNVAAFNNHQMHSLSHTYIHTCCLVWVPRYEASRAVDDRSDPRA